MKCFDLTKSPRGWLRCMGDLGHRGMHLVDPAGPEISQEMIVAWDVGILFPAITKMAPHLAHILDTLDKDPAGGKVVLSKRLDLWVVGAEWGLEVEGSDIVGAAAYGADADLLEAIRVVAEQMGYRA